MSALADIYAEKFKACTIKPEHEAEVRAEAGRIMVACQTYEEVVKPFPSLPWWVVGILHSMECGLDFHTHLHNGDPLTHRTVQVPKGRPLSGQPPFTFVESAQDAVQYDSLDKVQDWSPGNALVILENYNGTGYRRRGVPSPYLCSFTNEYRSGKYTSDVRYDPLAVSKQCGCAALMKVLLAEIKP